MVISYWMASIIVEQKIFQEVREKIEEVYNKHTDMWFCKKFCQLINCVVCTGFWCGLFITWTGFDLFSIDPIWDLFYGALFGSFSAYLGSIVVGVIERVIKLKYDVEI